MLTLRIYKTLSTFNNKQLKCALKLEKKINDKNYK